MNAEEIRIAEESKKAQGILTTENASLKKQLADRATSDFVAQAITEVSEALSKAEITASPKLIARACANPVIKTVVENGLVTGTILDSDWIKGIVEDFSPGTSGRVEGMGPVHTRESDTGEPKKEDVDKRLRESLAALGTPEPGLNAAVAGR